MKAFVRPEEEFLHVEREAVAGSCPACGGEALARYPVLSEGGWWDVVKCQGCLTSVERRRGGLFGPISLLSEDL